ncbi:MAG: DUF4249 family protein [bacterium]|nr:DUF4249 family protein [bacterium]
MNKLSYIFFGLILSLAACKEKIEIAVPDSDPLLVVEGEVTTELDSSYVKLSLTSNYYSADQSPLVTNATINVNGVPFLYNAAKGKYIPNPGYIGKTDSSYSLNISANGKTFSAVTKLEKMFRIDSFFQVYKEAAGFLPAGFSLSYVAYDDRPLTKYTYFVNGYFDTIAQRDSFSDNKILFDNAQTPANEPYNFEIPFARFNSGDEYIAIFRSVDKNMFDFINAFENQNPSIPGPFQTPPANLPTNIVGGAVGYFTGYGVQRWRYKVK